MSMGIRTGGSGIRQAFISGGVAYHHGLTEPGQPLAGFDVIDLGALARTDLNRYDLVVVPRSADGDALYALRHQIARFLDHGGVLLAFGELWANWFPGCDWREECAEDVLAPVVVRDHPILNGLGAEELHWHPSKERWCCHGHFAAPAGAEVLVANQRGDAWLYVDRVSSNGVIAAASNLDPDTHSFHGSQVARRFFDQLLAWARMEAEAGRAEARRARGPRRIAGLYSGVHFQQAFYRDPEFAARFAILPVWELGATELHDYAALWIPRESNQNVLVAQRDKLRGYLASGGTIVCWDEVNQPWLPAGDWSQRKVDLDTLRLTEHPLLRGLTSEQLRWHSHGAYQVDARAEVLLDDGQGNVLLFLDERSFAGTLLAGTLDPDCHAGFGTEQTRPLLRAILGWLEERAATPQRPVETVSADR